MKKVKVATVWLDGCSGCHMSLLDMDAAIIALARKIDLVYGPLVDAQEFPEDVDVTLVEGAVSSQDDLDKIQKIRQRTNMLISLGDCAVTGNVPAHAQLHSGAEIAAAHLRRRGRRRKSRSVRARAGVAEAGAAAARIRQGGSVFAGLSAALEGDRRRDQRSAGRQEARRQLSK